MKDYKSELYVYRRPYLDKFLKAVSKLGTVSLFTASMKSYADQIVDDIDPKGIIKKRYYRDHCKTDKNGNILKDMAQITTNKQKLVIIDDGILTYNMYKSKKLITP